MEKKIKFFVFVGVVCLWWFGSFFINKLFLPSPVDVFKTMGETLKSGLLVESFFSSLWRITVATLYSGIFAILIASLVVNSKTLEKIIVPITATSRYIPVTVFYPLLIMWLGIGEKMKITFLFLATFLFFLPTTIQTFEETDRNLIEAGKVMGMGKLKRMRYIIFPSAAPTLFKSFLMMYAIGWTYVIIAESINTTKGLGYLMNIGTARGKTDLVFVAILTIVFTNFLFDWLGNQFIKRKFEWKLKTTKAGD